MKKGYIIAALAVLGVIGLSQAIYSSQSKTQARMGSGGVRSTGAVSRSFSGGSKSFSGGGRSFSGRSPSFSGGTHSTTHVSRSVGAGSRATSTSGIPGRSTTRTGGTRTSLSPTTSRTSGLTRTAGTRTTTGRTPSTGTRTHTGNTRTHVAGAHQRSNQNFGHGWSGHNWHNRNAFLASNWGIGFNGWWLGWGLGSWWWSPVWGLPYVTTLPSCAYVRDYDEDGNDIYYCDGYYFAPYGGYYYVSPQPTFSFSIGVGF